MLAADFSWYNGRVKIRKNWQKFIGVFLILLIVGVTLYFISPEKIVAQLGVSNSLLVAFLVSLLGGVSTLTSASFFAVIGALAVGGVDPVYLAAAAAPGLFIGDIAFYYFGLRLRDVLEENYQRQMTWLSSAINNRHHGLVTMVIFLYTGFSPFPGDILMVALASARYPFKKVIFPLLAGNFALAWVIAYAAITGTKLFLG